MITQAEREAETARMHESLMKWLHDNLRPELPYTPMAWVIPDDPRDWMSEVDLIYERRQGNVR